MTNPAQMAAIRRNPSAALPSPMLDAASDGSELVVTVLRFAMGPEEQGNPLICYWGTISSDSELQDDEIEIHSFNADDMSKDEIAQQVVFQAMELLIKNSSHDFNMHIDQEILRVHIESVQSIVPGIRVLDHANRVGIRQSLRVREQINAIIVPLFSERDKRLNGKQETARLATISPERFVYVDASIATGGEDVGFGYVVKDVIINSETGEECWDLAYGSAVTTVARKEGSTGAELQAILDTLYTPKVITKDIRDGNRSLTIISDSKWGIELLNALRYGTKPCINEKIKALWWLKADRIVKKLANIEHVEFKWVKGHGTDLLNDAADRLALSERRNDQADIPLDARKTVRRNIIAHTLEGLDERGIKATARDLRKGSTQ